MRHILIVAFFLAISADSFSQTGFLQDPVTSKNFNTEKYSSIRGTPFLVDKWIVGNVVTPRGVYKNLDLKFNVYENAVFFNKDDQTFEFQDVINSFMLMPKPGDTASFMVYKKGIAGADLKGNEFVQVLLEGPVGLYKLDVKQLSEMSEINAGIVKTFTNNSKYYISRNKQLQFIKLNKTEVLNALSDKQDKIQAYINDKKYNFRKEAELVDVLKYYSQL